MTDLKCSHCGVYTNIDLIDIICPHCENPSMFVPHMELLEAQHELLQQIATTVIRFHEDLKRLELRLFPEEPPPEIKRGKRVH